MRILSTFLSIILTIIFIPFQVIFWIFLFLRANFGSNRVSINDFDIEAKTKNIQFNDGVVSIDSEDYISEEVAALKKEFSLLLEIPEHKAAVKHAYTSDFIDHEGHCPRCNSSTEQRNANFVYDAGPEVRVMYVPAGYFCLKCPTVFVDIDMIKKGVAKNSHFENLIGIDFENHDDTNFFSTFNGEAVIYTLEGASGEVQSAFIPEFTVPPSIDNQSRKQKRKKRKTQKQARKKNRPKK